MMTIGLKVLYAAAIATVLTRLIPALRKRALLITLPLFVMLELVRGLTRERAIVGEVIALIGLAATAGCAAAFLEALFERLARAQGPVLYARKPTISIGQATIKTLPFDEMPTDPTGFDKETRRIPIDELVRAADQSMKEKDQ